MKISIITPSYNQAQFIERTILSVLEQDYQPIEYIVIDGCSTDGTLEVLRKYSKEITWISERDAGQADAINKGLRLATGDVVAFLNSDDTYEPGALSRVAQAFRENPETEWIYGKCRIINSNDVEIRRPITYYKNFFLKHYTLRRLLSENFISQPATFWRRSVHNKVGYFDTSEYYCMDYEFWLRLGFSGGPKFIDEYLANFRFYTGSKSGGVSKKQFQDELRIARMYSKNNSLPMLYHKFNYYKIILIYKMLAQLNRLRGKSA